MRDLTALTLLALLLGTAFIVPFIAYKLMTKNRGTK